MCFYSPNLGSPVSPVDLQGKPQTCESENPKTMPSQRLSRHCFCRGRKVQTPQSGFTEHFLLHPEESVVLQPRVPPHSPLQGFPARKPCFWGQSSVLSDEEGPRTISVSFLARLEGHGVEAARERPIATVSNIKKRQRRPDDTRRHQDIFLALITCVMEN